MRIATFNIENLDEQKPGSDGKLKGPTLEARFEILRPQLARINADILCLQEVHGQEPDGEARSLQTLNELLQGTQYEGWSIVHTVTTEGIPYDVRNLVVVTRFPIVEHQQLRNDRIDTLLYRPITEIPLREEAGKITWERPILHATLDWNGTPLHLINLHLKSRLPSRVKGQDRDRFSWKSVGGWAEGYFISSMKRVGQALETRILIDELLDANRDALIVVCGDFNAEPGEVPVETIVGRIENTGNPELGFRQLLPCSNTLPGESRYTHLHEGQGNLLDHMVISRAMMAYYQSAEIHNEALHDESIAFASDVKYPESDHAPFVVEFREKALIGLPPA